MPIEELMEEALEILPRFIAACACVEKNEKMRVEFLQRLEDEDSANEQLKNVTALLKLKIALKEGLFIAQQWKTELLNY